MPIITIAVGEGLSHAQAALEEGEEREAKVKADAVGADAALDGGGDFSLGHDEIGDEDKDDMDPRDDGAGGRGPAPSRPSGSHEFGRNGRPPSRERAAACDVLFPSRTTSVEGSLSVSIVNSAIVNPAQHHATDAARSGRRAFNFSAGPGVLAEEVIRQAQHDLWDINGTGIGIMEHSHRAKTFDKVLAEAEESCRRVGRIPANYKVLFLTGGATSQNFQIPANLLADNAPAAFLTTGYWAEKTFEESRHYSQSTFEAWDGRPVKHAYCPADSELNYNQFGGAPAYVHMCSNNTIYGTQWRNADGSFRYPKMPSAAAPLVCDMSSDIYSRPLDMSKFGVIYAGAQKNVGIAGTTLLIIREDLLVPVRKLPTMLRYDVMAKDQSRHNTPPAFAIYLSGLVFKWIESQGGLEVMHKRNMDKAAIIYKAIDESSGFYTGHARADSRSLMNILFKSPSAELDDRFIAEALKNGMDQLKGHRSTGGIRASTYNAMPKAGCEALAAFMREFAKKNG